MQTNRWLTQSTQTFKSVGIESARLDALILLEDATGTNRTHLLAHPEQELSIEQLNVLKPLVERRAKHEPLAYLRGKSEFYGREFLVSPAVLVPRPESESMIELLLTSPGLPPQVRIADVGTGSGALGITAKLELPDALVELIDIDDAALEIAKMNVIKHTTNISTIKSNLLVQSSQRYDILLCNLPYVPDGYSINTAATHEPKIALFGGPDGLHLYHSLFKQVATFQKRPLLILTEALTEEHESMQLIAERNGYILVAKSGLIQSFQLI